MFRNTGHRLNPRACDCGCGGHCDFWCPRENQEVAELKLRIRIKVWQALLQKVGPKEALDLIKAFEGGLEIE